MQRTYLIVGGPLDGQAFRPEGGRFPGEWVRLGPHTLRDEYVYRIVRTRRPAEPIMLPIWALVHDSVPRNEVTWQIFMGTMRAWAAEILR